MKDENDVIYGTPTMVLFPAQHYVFRVLEDIFQISIPRTGTYNEIDPEFFAVEDGEFNILDAESNTLWFPSISKVLFATKKYPDLKPNQLFAPLSLIFKDNEVIIIGKVLEMALDKEKV